MAQNAFEQLVELMKKLRAKGGCPWDWQQTHQSLRQYLLEETYEVLESIDERHFAQLKEELGDLLLQIVFHAQIADEEGYFNIADVIETITTKLVERHPHVFPGRAGAEKKILSFDEQAEHWEKMKVHQGRHSALDGVPKELPALLRAYRIQDKAARVGFDWRDLKDVWAKVLEELKEFKQSCNTNDQTRIEEEFGDLLFSLVNISRFIGINPEDSLRKTIKKFIKRFQIVEQELKAKGKKLEETSLEEMDRIWEKTKDTIP